MEKNANLDRIEIILVDMQDGANIGSACRATKTASGLWPCMPRTSGRTARNLQALKKLSATVFLPLQQPEGTESIAR